MCPLLTRGQQRTRHAATLGVPIHADLNTLHSAYLALVQRYHPDRFLHPNRSAAEERLHEINVAYSALRTEASQ